MKNLQDLIKSVKLDLSRLFSATACTHLLEGFRSHAAVLALVLVLALVAFASRGLSPARTLSTAVLPQQEQSTPAEAPVDTAAALEARIGITHDVIYAGGDFHVQRLEPLPPQLLRTVDSETLWLARCIYSETKRPEEQELVAWVIRNRVETGYRGKHSYQSVVLDPYQFSAFNRGTRTRQFYSNLTTNSREAGWQKALAIAHVVKEAPAAVRPFSEETRHFYSAQSMAGGRQPAWARGKRPVMPQRGFKLQDRRFRFYEGVI